MMEGTYPCDCGERIDVDSNYCPCCGEEVVIEWPLEFTLPIYSMPTLNERIEIAEIPGTDEIMSALQKFPGEATIHFNLSHDLTLSPTMIEYDGMEWTPK